MILPQYSKLIMIGDSITDCNRNHPIADNLNNSGNGYVKYVQAELRANHPESFLHIYNMGISGNTSQDLVNRWDTDVLQYKPDFVSIMIGVNDIWRQFNRAYMQNPGIELAQYTKNVTEMIEKTKNNTKQIFLLTPFICETNKDEPFRKQIDSFGLALKKIANEFKLIFIDVQAAMDHNMKFQHPCTIANDRVHPSPGGNRIIANAFLKAIEAI